MKERPILFTGDMVRAILDGRKTQTRRPMKPQPPSVIEYPPEGRDGWFCSGVLGARDWGSGLEWTVGAHYGEQPCPQRWLHLLPRLNPPLGTAGDQLWVRETFRIYRSFIECACYDDCQCASMNGKPLYRASDPSPDDDKWTPSIHMPRWASRIDLEITAVRVERVQGITEEDARKEGIVESEIGRIASRTLANYKMIHRAPEVIQFADLWQSIYGTWDANPWVWVYEFRRVKP